MDESIWRLKNRFQCAMEELKAQLSGNKIASLWFLYMEYITIVKQYILAERTSNWKLHLSSVAKMLNLFAATGHVHYTKSARFYLQQMSHLEHTAPEVFSAFANSGLHAVHRSDKVWSGLWTDLIIEQVMMQSLKMPGGLTC